MIERALDIATQDGAMNTWTVRPDDGGPLPVVLMLMDAPGVREGLREICRRIAQSGYYVLLPNLYYRTTREFELGATRDHPDAEANLKKMFAMVGSIANDKVAADVGAILDRLPSLANAKPGKIGLVGYCMSGAFVTVAAARHPDRIGCFASYYGTRLITDKPDSPHLMLWDIKAEGYYAFAEHDLDHVQTLAHDDDVERLAAAGDTHLNFFVVHVTGHCVGLGRSSPDCRQGWVH